MDVNDPTCHEKDRQQKNSRVLEEYYDPPFHRIHLQNHLIPQSNWLDLSLRF